MSFENPYTAESPSGAERRASAIDALRAAVSARRGVDVSSLDAPPSTPPASVMSEITPSPSVSGPAEKLSGLETSLDATSANIKSSASEQLPATETDIPLEQPADAVTLRKRRLVSFIGSKLAAAEQQPATAISDGFVQQFRHIAESIDNSYDPDPAIMERKLTMYEKKLQTYGFGAEDVPAGAEEMVDLNVPVPETMAEPIVSEVVVEAACQTVSIDDVSALAAHQAEVGDVRNIIATVAAEAKLGRGTEGAARQKALGYARIDFQKWTRTAAALTQAMKTSPARSAELISLLQRHYDSLRTNIELFAPGHLLPVTYGHATPEATTSTSRPDKAESSVSALAAEPNESSVEVQSLESVSVLTETPAPLELGALERVANDEQLAAVLDGLDAVTLDEQDEQFVAICVENYQKFQQQGEVVKAGGYLHNLQEVLTRKRGEERNGTAHDVIKGRIKTIEASLEAMRVVDLEGAVTISALATNVRRLLDEAAEAHEPTIHEQKIQQTYQSLESLYRDLTGPEPREVESAVPEVAVTDNEQPVILEEPREQEVVPVITGAAARELRPNSLVEAEATERMSRVRALWNRFPDATKAAMIAMLAVFASPDTSSKQAEGFNPLPATATGTIESGWVTADASAQVPVAINAVTGSIVEIPAQVVRPFTPQVVAAEEAMAASPAVHVETVSLAADVAPDAPLASGEALSLSEQESQLSQSIGIPREEAPAPVSAVETAAPTQPVAPSPETAPVVDKAVPDFVDQTVEVIYSDASTYPDRAIDTVLAAVDTQGLPDTLVDMLKAETKTAFLEDTEALRAAGISSGDKNIVYAGEQINYGEVVQAFTESINQNRQFLNLPHSEVAQDGENLTTMALRSYASDLAVIPESDRLAVTENALANYLTEPSALSDLHLDDPNYVRAGAVVPLGSLAQQMANSVAEYVKSTVAAEPAPTPGGTLAMDSESEMVAEVSDASSDGLAEVTPDAMSATELTPQTYPGGILQYSQDYNQALESIGIASASKSFMDPWFSRGPDNRGLLDVTVGQLDKIMDMRTSQEILAELTSLGIELDAAEKAKKTIIEARKNGVLPMKLGLEMTFADLMKMLVLKAAQAET